MVLDSLKFWKKEDPLTDTSFDLGRMPSDPFPTQQASPADAFSQINQQMDKQFPPGPSFQSAPSQQWQPEQGITMTHRDVELILAKLDAIRSELDALHQRVRKIEQATETKDAKRYW